METVPAFKYPQFPRGDVVDRYAIPGEGSTEQCIVVGPLQQVPDPYRALEDVDSEQTRMWVDAENALTRQYLDSFSLRTEIAAGMRPVFEAKTRSVPVRHGRRWFFTENGGFEQDQQILYVSAFADGRRARPVIAPAEFQAEHSVYLQHWVASPKGNYVAYSLSVSGSDTQRWYVRQVAGGEQLPEEFADVLDYRYEVLKYLGSTSTNRYRAVVWAADESGFFYGKLDGEHKAPQVLWHKLGSPVEQDKPIGWGWSPTLTDDGHYLLAQYDAGTVSYCDLRKPQWEMSLLKLDEKGLFWFIGNRGNRFYFKTNREAPNGRVVSIVLDEPGSLRIVLSEQPHKLDGAAVVGRKLVCVWLVDAANELSVHDLTTSVRTDVSLPGLCSVSQVQASGTRVFFSISSFACPHTVYELGLNSGKYQLVHQPQVGVDLEQFEVKRLWAISKDGTKVPVFVAHKKGLVLNGRNAAYLWGYGGFRNGMKPSFAPNTLYWLSIGGVVAVACTRGGGEYAEPWHRNGTKHQKQNVFDDFIAAAECLIATGYTSSKLLTIGGGSNGGLLMGACLTQRPDLFGAVLAVAGLYDMLRVTDLGGHWEEEYGVAYAPLDFAPIYAYSPLHHVVDGTSYPAVMIVTSWDDDRVNPVHSFKFAAALQHAQSGDAPVLLRVSKEVGHNSDTMTNRKLFQEAVDRWVFVIRALGPQMPGLAQGAAAA